jgi:hypothetical protein
MKPDGLQVLVDMKYSIFSKLALPPKSVAETVTLSTEIQAHLLLWPIYNRFKEQNLQILYSLFNPASLFLASLTSGRPGLVSFWRSMDT